MEAAIFLYAVRYRTKLLSRTLVPHSLAERSPSLRRRDKIKHVFRTVRSENCNEFQTAMNEIIMKSPAVASVSGWSADRRGGVALP